MDRSSQVRFLTEPGPGGGQHTHRERVVLRQGQSYKSATICTYGEDREDRPANKQLEICTFERLPTSGAYDFDDPVQRFTCNEREIPILQAFLNKEFPQSGSYTPTEPNVVVAAIARQIEDGQVDAAAVSRLIAALSQVNGVAEALADADPAGLLTGMVERRRQQQRLAAIRTVVEDSTKNETDIQREMKTEWWLFGGRYISVNARRGLTTLHEVDIPLIRADGALHIVELKKANVPRLVVDHRGEWVVGPEVNLAVGQVMNYMRAFDERRRDIQDDFGMDPRRAAATVVIGHPGFVTTGASAHHIAEALRTYNSHLSRVEVITFEELLDGAERSFSLSAPDGAEDESEEPDFAEW